MRVLMLPDDSGEGGFFEQIREHLPSDKQAEYDQFLTDYLDFGSVFSRSEVELAGMNRRVGDFYVAATGVTSEAGNDTVPEDNGGWMVQAMYFSMGKRHDYRAALKQVLARSLVIHGEADVIPEGVSRMYVDCLAHSRLHVMKNGRTRGGHLPFSEQPDAFAAVVSDFLMEKH